MKHDLEAFARDIVTLIKTSGDTGDSGDKSKKSLRESDNFVPTHCADVSPLVLEWGQPVSTSGDRKREQLQHDDSSVPSVPTVPTHFRQGPDRPAETDAPAEWYAIVAELRRRDSVEWLSADRWREFIVDAEIFLSAWGNAAEQLGWQTLDLFGVHPVVPTSRFDAMGLALLIQGGVVIALTEQTATIRRRSGAVLTYRRHAKSEAVLISKVQA